MEVSYSNELSQKQALNAQLLHSLSILRMNAQGLRDYIHTLSLENPMVELVTPPQRRRPLPRIAQRPPAHCQICATRKP